MSRLTKWSIAALPLAGYAVIGGLRLATAGGLGVPQLDSFMTNFATGVQGMGVAVGGVGLVGYVGSLMENPFSTILSGSINFITKAGMLGGGTAVFPALGLTAGATLTGGLS